jgi:chemotaxis regulatin CheY-phosphate phosphatase CheZ
LIFFLQILQYLTNKFIGHMYTIFSFIHSAGSHILLLLICISKSSTSKEKHANLNLPPLMKTKQFRFVSPQDRICDKNDISMKPFLGSASA